MYSWDRYGLVRVSTCEREHDMERYCTKAYERYCRAEREQEDVHFTDTILRGLMMNSSHLALSLIVYLILSHTYID